MSNLAIQETPEEETLPETQEIQQETPQQTQAIGEQEAPQSVEIVLNDEDKKHSPETNAKFAARRIARKRQRELEQAVNAITHGEVPEGCRVNPELPPQPDLNTFLSDSVLHEKYSYDTTRAMAAFNAAQNEWLLKVQDARSNAIAEQSRKTQEFTRQSSAYATAAKTHYDAAEKLNLPDFDEKEEVVRSLLPKGLDAEIMSLFPEKSAALFYHLGANPEKLRDILALSPQQALISLTRLSDRLTIKPRDKAVSQAPPIDEPVLGDITAAHRCALEKKMKAAADKGDVDTYRKYKTRLKG